MIAADGCVDLYKNKLKKLSLGFHVQEKEIIELFIKYSHSEYVPNIHDNVMTLQINSNKRVNALKTQNIVPRKIWIDEPTQIEPELMWHSLRGYFAGDGSIYLSGKRNPCHYLISRGGNEPSMRFCYIF